MALKPLTTFDETVLAAVQHFADIRRRASAQGIADEAFKAGLSDLMRRVVEADPNRKIGKAYLASVRNSLAKLERRRLTWRLRSDYASPIMLYSPELVRADLERVLESQQRNLDGYIEMTETLRQRVEATKAEIAQLAALPREGPAPASISRDARID